MADVLLAAADSPAALRLPGTIGDGPCRVAVLDPTPDRVDQARRIIAAGDPWRGAGDIWFAPEPLGGRLAFLFPGLDTRLPARPDDVAGWFGLPAVPWADPSSLGGHTRNVLRLNRTLDTALRRLGVAPDVVAGHSSGEWSALFAAGTFPGAAFDEFAAGMDGFTVPDVVFAAVGLPAAEAARLAGGQPRVVVSHDNAPGQSVLCGDEDAVDRCLARITDPAVPRKVLPFRSGFHSPMLAPHLPEITRLFDRIRPGRPTVPVWSATTVAPYPAGETELSDLLVRHLLEPVRFRQVVTALHDAGTRLFVQVGCGSLPRLVASTLVGRPHAVVSAGASGRSQLDQLRWAAAALWAEGRAPDLAALGLATASRDPVTAAYEAAVASVRTSIDVVYRTWRQRA